jgi:hypothetical protein
MATTIVTKNSSTAAAVPTAAQLVQGELAVNVADKRLYTEDNGGAIVELGVNPSAEITANAGIALPDSQKATFGAGDDLQIYHDGSNSYVADVGTGRLLLSSDGDGVSVVTNTGENLIRTDNDGQVRVYFNNAEKLRTNSTGIDVTGTATMDGAEIDVTRSNTAGSGFLTLDLVGTSGDFAHRVDTSNAYYLDYYTGSAWRPTIKIEGQTGDISFYEDTGTTAKLFWDASAESLGIGTSSPDAKLRITGGYEDLFSAAGTNGILTVSNPSENLVTMFSGTGDALALGTSSTERMRRDASGNVGIGVAPYSWSNLTALQLERASVSGGDPDTYFTSNGYYSTTAPSGWKYGSTTTATQMYMNASGGEFVFRNATSGTADTALSWSERMRIDSSGRVGIGTSSPNVNLEILSGGTFTGAIRVGDSGSSRRLILEQTDVLTYTIGGTGTNSVTRFVSGGSAGIGTERMRIDSSGNLLVGKTADTQVDAGHVIFGTGAAYSSRNGFTWLHNRLSTDGEILLFQKDSTTVGSIGVEGGDLTIGNADTGLQFVNTSQIIRPQNLTTNSAVDAQVSLGQSAYRFKDAYLSGGVYLGGTGAANKLEDYETGTWTPTGVGLLLSSPSGTYTKVGRLVTVTWQFVYPTTNSGSQTSIAGLPFTVGTGYTNGGNQGYVNGSAAVSIAHITAVTTSLLYRTANGGTALTHADFSGATVRGSMTYMTA